MYEIYAQVRDSKGMKDSEVAELADIRQGILSDWKNGKSSPSTKNLQKIAYALNVSVDYLMTGKMPEKQYSDEIMELAKEIHDKPHLRRLMRVAAYSNEWDLSMLTHVLKRLNSAETFPDD